MKRLATVGLAALALALAPGLAAAQANAPSPHKLELARQIIDASGQRQVMMSMMQGALRQAMQSAAKDLPPDKQAQSQTVADVMSAVYGKMGPKILDMAVEAYAETYTEDELTQILAFMRSPAGQAMSAKAPQMTQTLLSKSMALMPEMRHEFLTEFCARITCTAEQRAALAGGTGAKP